MVDLTTDILAVTAKSAAGSEIAALAFDGTYLAWCSNIGDMPTWWQVQLKTAKIVTSYSILRRDDLPDRNIKDFTFQGSNDGTSWTILDTRAEVTWPTVGQTQTFTFTNSTAYSYYRIDITANGGNSWTSLAEVDLDGVQTLFATASSEAGSQWVPENAFDGVIGEGNDAWASNTLPAWLQVAVHIPVAATGYSVAARPSELTQSPRDWTFLGSYDGVTWTTLDTRVAQIFTSGQFNDYSFTNPIEYKFYRINVTAVNGSTLAAISELVINVGIETPEPPQETSVVEVQNFDIGNSQTVVATLVTDLVPSDVVAVMIYHPYGGMRDITVTGLGLGTNWPEVAGIHDYGNLEAKIRTGIMGSGDITLLAGISGAKVAIYVIRGLDLPTVSVIGSTATNSYAVPTSTGKSYGRIGKLAIYLLYGEYGSSVMLPAGSIPSADNWIKTGTGAGYSLSHAYLLTSDQIIEPYVTTISGFSYYATFLFGDPTESRLTESYIEALTIPIETPRALTESYVEVLTPAVGPIGPPITPDTLGLMSVWFKADAITGKVDGDNLTSLTDSSSRANNLTTVNGSAPKYRTTGGPLDLPCIDHTTSPGGLYATSAIGMPTGDYTFFAVIQAGGTGIQSLLNAYTADNAQVRLNSNKIELDESGVAAIKTSITSLVPGEWTIVLVTYTAVGKIVHFDIGGIIEDYAIGGTTSFSSTGISYGEYQQSGARFEGKIAEIGMYAALLNPDNLSALKTYLSEKYIIGIPSGPSEKTGELPLTLSLSSIEELIIPPTGELPFNISSSSIVQLLKNPVLGLLPSSIGLTSREEIVFIRTGVLPIAIPLLPIASVASNTVVGQLAFRVSLSSFGGIQVDPLGELDILFELSSIVELTDSATGELLFSIDLIEIVITEDGVLQPYIGEENDVLIPILLTGQLEVILPEPVDPVDFDGISDPIEAPVLERSITPGGNLPPGTYRYRYAAWVGSEDEVTAPSPHADITLITQNTVTLTYPTIDGAQGYVVYREEL